MSGWIRLYRSSFDNRLYFSEPFTRWQAWCDLLLLANHKDNYFFVRNISVKVPRGSVGYSIEELSKRWKWSRGKAERFMCFLESQTVRQIVRQKNNITTLISIVNYESYQADGNAEYKQDSTTNGQQTVKQTDINKNDKKEKNEKKDRGTGDLASPEPPPKIEAVFKATDGSMVKVAALEFTAKDFNGLPEKYAMIVANNIRSVKQVEVSKDRLTSAWESFKELEIKKKLYRNEEDVYSFFSNYCKRQSWAKDKDEKTEGKPAQKKGKVLGVKFLNEFTECEMNDGSIQKLSINQIELAKYNQINPNAILKS